jgi:two-component sensor histidine kinase
MTTKTMTAAEVPGASTSRTMEADHLIANQLGQLAALLTKQIKATALGPELLSRQSVLDTLHMQHGRLLGISRLHRALSRQLDQDQVDLSRMLSDLLGEFEASGVFGHRLHLEWTFAEHCLVDAWQASAITLAFSEIVTTR